MKCKYKGYDLEVTREKCLGGWDMAYRTAYLDGCEVVCDFSNTEDRLSTIMADLKKEIDDRVENPQFYDD